MIEKLLVYQASVSAGWLSGSMHALTGVDHISAIFPLSINKRFFSASWYGFLWGLGHGITSLIIGIIGSYTRKFVVNFNSVLDDYRFLGDLMVAVTLIVIGVMGIYENVSDEENGEDESISDKSIENQHISDKSERLSERNGKPKIYKNLLLYWTVLLNGLLLGLSWDGLPSLAPALLLQSSTSVIAFLFSYLLSTILIMSLVAGLIGEGSYWLSKTTQDNNGSTNVAERLAYFSSLSACFIGVIWFVSAIIKCHQFWKFIERSTTSYNDNVVLSVTDGFWTDTMLQRWESNISIALNILSAMVVISTVLLGVFVDPTTIRSIWMGRTLSYRNIFSNLRSQAVQVGFISKTTFKSKIEYV